MKKMIKLLVDEINRNRKFYSILVISLIILELISHVLVIRTFHKFSESVLDINSFFFDNDFFRLILGAAILAVIIYIIFSWYREWHIKGKFIYRLLMIPGNRWAFAWAKWASMMLMSLSMIGIQLIMIILTDKLANFFIPNYISGLYYAFTKLNGFFLLIFPNNWQNALFLISLISVITLCLSIIQIITYGISYKNKWKKIVALIIYLLVTFCIIFVPMYFIVKNFVILDQEGETFLLILLILSNIIQGFYMNYLVNNELSV